MTLQVVENYNDNIFLVDGDRPTPEELEDETDGESSKQTDTDINGEEHQLEQELSDFITTVSPGLELGYVLDQVRADLQGRFDIVQYADYTELNDVDQFYDLGLDYEFSEYTRFKISGEYSRDSSPDQELEESGLLLGPTVRKKQEYHFTAAHAATIFSSINFTYVYGQDDFSSSRVDNLLVALSEEELTTSSDEPKTLDESENDEQNDDELTLEEQLRERHELKDSKLHSMNIAYSYDTGRWWTDSSLYSSIDYLHYGTEKSIQDNVTLVLGGAYSYDGTFSIRLDGGVRYGQESYDDKQLKLLSAYPFFELLDIEGSQEEYGPVGHLYLDYVGEMTTVGLSCSYDLQPASGKGTLTERTEFRLDLKHRFDENFLMHLSGSYILNNRDGIVAGEPVADQEALEVHNMIPQLKEMLEDEPEEYGAVDEESFNVGLKAIWEMNRYFTLTGRYSYMMFRKELIDSDARRNFVSLKIDFHHSFL